MTTTFSAASIGRLRMEPAGSGATWTSEARPQAENWEVRVKLGQPSDLALLQKTFDRMK